jgi:hypothetical protein
MNSIKLPYSEIEAEIEATPMIMPDSVIEITENGRYNVAKYSYADVNVEGGSSWQTVFEGSVTTVDRDGFADGLIGDFVLTANSIKVTFNGTEYTCERNEDDTYGAENIIPTGYDFSEYPFCITYDGVLITPNAGTYTLKIEEPQSGGSSDFSTAEVTISNESGTTIPIIYIQNVIEENALGEESPSGVINAVYNIGSTASIQIPLYKGGALWQIGDELLDYEISVSGSATKVASAIYHITGDCTITIS